MNNTVIEYSINEKVALPFVFLPCLLLVFIMYKYAKRRLVDSDTFAKRMQYLYGAAAGGIMGQFLFHTLRKSTSASVEDDHVFIFIGWFLMLFIQKYTRVNNENEFYTSPSLPSQEIVHHLDNQDVQLNSYYEASNLEEPIVNNQTTFSREMFAIMDETKEKYKRRILFVMFYIPMVFISIIEGFFLMYRVKTTVAATIGIFYVNKLIQTFVVCVVLLHSMFHAERKKRRHMYAIAGIFYCLVCLLSSIPALVGQDTTIFVENVVVTKLYLFIVGMIMYIAQYFAWLDRKQTNKKETIVVLVMVLVFGASSYATGIFL